MIVSVQAELRDESYYEGWVMAKTNGKFTRICTVTGLTMLGVLDRMGDAIARYEAMPADEAGEV